MKRTHTLFAIMAICCAMMVSCKNNKTVEPSPEEIQAQKVTLADSVLAKVDAIAERFYDAASKSFRPQMMELTDAEKSVKPDYLLDPSYASTLVTKSQKVNALALFLADMPIRKIYNMPMGEAKEVIAKLAAEINHPVDVNVSSDFEMPISEKIKKEYEACKELGDLAYFWQLHNALLTETGYIIAQNPDLFFNKITEEQWKGFANRTNECIVAIRELAKYDEEMAGVLEMFNQNRAFASDEEKVSVDASIESAKQYIISNKDKFIAKRNALLQ